MAFDESTHDAPKVVRGSRHKRLLSEAIQLEEEVVPQFIKPALFVVTALVAAFAVWSAFVNIDEVAVAPGEIVPSGAVKVVEHLEGGAVREILVGEGDRVEAGQALVILNGAQAVAEMEQMKARFVALRLRAERLSAFAEAREPDFTLAGASQPGLVLDQQKIYRNQLESQRTSRAIVHSQIEQRKRELIQMRESLAVARQQQKVTAEMVVMRKKMADRKLIPKMVFLETRRAKITADGEVTRILDQIKVTKQTVTESQRRLADLDAQLRRESLAEMGSVSAEIAEVRNGIARLKDRVDRLEVTSPTRGLVQDLKLQTVGQIVQPGALLMRIVPIDETLEASVRIRTNDIGHVKVGQPVTVKVGSYDFSRFGGVPGKLHRISASSIVEENGDAYFKGWVQLERPYVGGEPGKYPVTPGMNVDADIATGSKTLLEYMLKPLSDAMNRAFRER